MIKFTTLKYHYKVSIRISKITLWFFLILCFVIGSVIGLKRLKIPKTIVSPIPEEPMITITPTPTLYPEAQAKEKARKNGKILEGWATWYGTGATECLGCNPQRIMANGQRLDDTALTVACNEFPLGTKVVVQKVDEEGGGRIVTATVTDRHGANIVVDMTKAVRDSIGCQGKCWVKVWPL